MKYSALSGLPWHGMNVLAFGTRGDGGDGLLTVTVVNFGVQTQTVNLSGKFHESFELGQVVVASNGGSNVEGDIIDLAAVNVGPKESFVMKLADMLTTATTTTASSGASRLQVMPPFFSFS